MSLGFGDHWGSQQGSQQLSKVQAPQLGSPSTGSLGASQGSPGGTSGKEPACQLRRHKRPRFDPWVMEDLLATHSSILVWKIPQTEELGGLWFIGSKELDATKAA